MEAKTNIDVRINNRRRLAKFLFIHGEMTKQEVVGKLDMSLATVNYLVRELKESGLLTTGAALASTGGRKPICIKPVYTARCSIGVEASSDAVRIVALDLGTHIIAQESYEIPQENTALYWEQVGELVEAFRARNNISRETLLDVGVTLGITMQDEKPAERKKQSQEFLFDLEAAKESIGIPVHFRNSTKMAAIAQYWHCRTEDDFLYIYLGAKISGAAVFKGEVMDFSGINGEMGCMMTQGRSDHVRLDSVFSRKVLCKNAGCRNLTEFFGKIAAGDPGCEAIWEQYLTELAVFLHNMYCLFGWRIVFGGSISPYIASYLRQIEEKIRALYIFEELPNHILAVSDLGEFGSAVGAAMLPIDKFLDFAV